MTQIAKNTLLEAAAADKVSLGFGIKLIASAEIVHIAQTAGYDSLFIDLEHSALTIKDANQICVTAIAAGISPYVRVPNQCGSGFIQKVLDTGAQGVIAPHIHTVEDAKKVISVAKYKPLGNRSVSTAFPHFRYAGIPLGRLTKEMNESNSTVFIMVETQGALDNIDEIAALPSCDVLFLGPADLTMDMGIPGDWDSPLFIEALRKIGAAAKKHGKIFGVGGIYSRPDIIDLCVNELGARWVMGGQDLSLLQSSTKANCDQLKTLTARK